MSRIQNQTGGKQKPYSSGRLSKTGIAAVILVATLCIATCAMAALEWTGFTLTDPLSHSQQDALLEQASIGYANSYMDADRIVHYLDKDGKEVLVLSYEEAAAYEREQQAARNKAVIESTSVVDLSTVSLLPHQVIEMATGEEGKFANHLLGNGSMILLYPEGECGYTLKNGDTITVNMKAGQECRMIFSLFKDGKFLREMTLQEQDHSCTFKIDKDGVYCISAMYASASADSFTDCFVVVE